MFLLHFVSLHSLCLWLQQQRKINQPHPDRSGVSSWQSLFLLSCEGVCLSTTEWQDPNEPVSILLSSNVHIWLLFVGLARSIGRLAVKDFLFQFNVFAQDGGAYAKCFITYNDNSHLESFQSCQKDWCKKKVCGGEKKTLFCAPRKKKTLGSLKKKNQTDIPR